MRGNIFETFVISELIKARYNRGLPSRLSFWRDKTGNEIDSIIEDGARLIPVEIKAGQTVTDDYFKGMNYWNKISGMKHGKGYIIYAGQQPQKRQSCSVINWRNAAMIAVKR